MKSSERNFCQKINYSYLPLGPAVCPVKAKEEACEITHSPLPLSAIWDRFDAIWPSHGSFPVSPELIDKLHDGTIRVLEGRVEGKPLEMFGNSILSYDLIFHILSKR